LESQYVSVASEKEKEKNMEKIRKFIKDEEGLETVEYAIILGIVVVGTIALVAWLGGWVSGRFQTLQDQVGS
jgi:Flp pilus assembly pilin Flp